MQQKIFTILEKALKTDDRLVSGDGQLLKNKAVELAEKLDENLIELLAVQKDLKSIFFKSIAKMTIFDKDAFIAFVSNKQFLPDSYTAFKNKIGFEFHDGSALKYDKGLALVWPYKDCVLEGGQTKDDAKRREIFWNTTLAPDDITRILRPKVLTNFRRYDEKNTKKGHTVTEISDTDNFILKGNNLIALHSLKKRFAGKVKLIYIDPPYNTGNDSFQYNDSFNHSSWLTFMKNRLEASRELMREDGSIWINIDDGESHYLKVLCDEIFGRENFVANVVWQKKYSPQNDAKWFSDNHDHILVYAKNKENWRPNLLVRSEEAIARYKNPDNDPRGVWKSVDLTAKDPFKYGIYEIIGPTGKKFFPENNRHWVYAKDKVDEMIRDNRIWFGKSGENKPSLKKFLTEVQDGVITKTVWLRDEVGDNQEAKREFNALGFGEIFTTPKPERLIQRIIELSTQENDLVLDFFAGSGTTLAVAHKMKRQYIGVEQMEYIHDLPEARLKKVIEGEQGGISKAVGWTGGGSFVYAELKPQNERFIRQIESAKTAQETLSIWKAMEESWFVSWRVDMEKFDKNIQDFSALPLPSQKQALLEMLDMNMLYTHLDDIEDTYFNVSEEDKKLNKEFYGE